MRLRLAHRVFAPSVAAMLLTTAALAGLVTLGQWQLGRAREKQAMIDSFARGTQADVQLDARASIERLPRYQHVTARGRYDPAHQVLIDNMPSPAGMPGYRVLTPFVRDEPTARILFVDRGWVPLGASREIRPDVTVTNAPRSVAGRLDRLPAPGLRAGPAGLGDDAQWPRVLFFPEAGDLERALGRPVESRILLLDAAEPDGYLRAWRPAVGFGPNRHLGYAIQWFVLAAAVLVAFVALSLRPDAPGATGDVRPRPQS